MKKGLLEEDAREELEEELAQFSLLSNYLTKAKQQDQEFTELRQAESIQLVDGIEPIRNIIMMRNKNGRTQILNTSSTQYSKEKLDSLSEETGLTIEDITSLFEYGLQIEEISDEANNLPFKEISESAAIREMIKSKIDPIKLEELSKKGIQVVPLKDGSIQVNNIKKLAEVDEQGLAQIEPELLEELEPFEQVGLIHLSEELVIKEVEPEEAEKTKGNALKIVPLKEKQAEMTKDELEKQRMARDLGIDSNEIISVIRLEDRENGSKLLNNYSDKDTVKYLIRTRNGISSNKFIAAKENDDGTFEQLQGFETTPVAKEVANLIKDTQNGMRTVAVLPGEIKAGKTNPEQEKYNYFLIRRAGESKDDDSNNLLFVGTTGQTDMSLIESRNSGERQFVQIPTKSVHPSNIYLEGNTGHGINTELSTQSNGKDEDVKPTIKFEDINRKKELLERLRAVEDRIVEIENSSNSESTTSGSSDSSSSGASSSSQVKDDDLNKLYSERSQILNELGIKESSVVKEIEEEEYQPGTNTRRPH